MNSETYSAGLISQSFWFVETKKIIELIKNGKSEADIKKICIQENLFCVDKEYRANRIYGYLNRRIKNLDDDLLNIFIKSDLMTQKIIILFAIIKKDRLFFEFLYEVYREKIILGLPEISNSDFNIFIKNKEMQNETVEKWTDATKKRLGAAYLNFISDANLVNILNSKRIITPPIIDAELERYFVKTGNTIFMKAITGVN